MRKRASAACFASFWALGLGLLLSAPAAAGVIPVISTATLGGTGGGAVLAMTVGGGSLYAVGYTSSAATSDDIWISRWNAATLTLISSATFNGTANGNDEATGIVRDPATGDLYVLGGSSSTGQGLILWLAKFDPLLNMISTATLAIHLNANGFGEPQGIALAANGNLYTANSVLNGGLSDMCFSEFTSSLTFVSSTTYWNGFDQDYAYGLTTDNSSNLYLAGGVAPSSGTSNDMWLGKFNSNLVLLATGTVAGAGGNSDQALAIQIDPSNTYLFVTGYINNSGVISSLWVGKYNLNLDSLVAPVSVTGAGGGNSGGAAVVVGSTQVYVAGDYSTASGYDEIYLAQLDYSLNILSTYTYASSGVEVDNAFALGLDTTTGTLFAGGEINPAGTRSPWLGKFGTLGSSPTSGITAPVAGFLNALPAISGTAQAYSGAIISSVTVSVKNLSSGLYWTGVSFSSAVQSYSTATFTGASTGTWTYINGSLTTSLTSGTSYQIQSQAFDSYSQPQVAVTTLNFTYDTIPPTLAITTPTSGASGASFPTISGTAADPISGVLLASVQISSAPGFNTCWNGGSWVACPNYLSATGTANWSESAVPSGGALVPGTTYQIKAQATDGAGNIQLTISSFTYTGSGGGCFTSTSVTAGLNTIQSAVNSAGASLAGNYCINVGSGTYSEQVKIQNIATNGFQIIIASTTGGAPVINPPFGATAAFMIANASVSVQGINVVSTNSITYGVLVSSPNVLLAGVNVLDAAGKIATAGVYASSWTTVINSSVTVAAATASAIELAGSGSSVSGSTGTAAGATQAALWVNAASGSSISQSFFANASGFGVIVSTGSSGNTISQSTMTGGSTAAGLYMSGSISNTISQSYIADQSGGNGALLDTGSNGNTITQSTIASNGASSYNGFEFNGASSNTITQSWIVDSAGNGLFLQNNANYNYVSSSTLTSTMVGNYALYINLGASFNTITQSFVNNPVSHATAFNANANYNTISQSSVTGTGYGIVVQTSSGNVFTGDYIRASTGVWVTASTGTAIFGSVLVATNTTGTALLVDLGSPGLSLTNSSFSAPPAGVGIALTAGDGGLLVFSTDTITGAKYGMLVSTPAAGASFGINSLSFASLAAGATAMQFTGGTYVSTFTSVSFDASVGANVNASTLGGGSSITMALPSGARAGPLFADDPNHYVHWPSSNAPTSAVTAPSAAFISSLSTLSGTAQAYNGANIASVGVSVKNLSNGMYWTGVSFSSATPLFSSTTFAGASSGTWAYAVGSLAASLTNGTTYQIQSQAMDSVAQTQVALSTYNFITFDTSPPTVAITSPASGSSGSSFPTISGTSADPISGVNQVGVQISSGPSFSTCWNGSSWTGCPNTVINGGGASWSDTTVPGNAFLVAGTTYQIQAVAVDMALNSSVPAISSFVFTGSGGGCYTVATVAAGVNTIQSAVNSAGPSLAGNYCINVGSGTYNEQVTIGSITTNGFSIIIASTTGSQPIINPPSASTAAFVISNASVSVEGINIVPANAIMFGALVMAPNVWLNGVNVSDLSGKIAVAGVSLSSSDTLSNSSITVTGASASGVWLTGNSNTFFGSTATAVTASGNALYLNAASFNTIGQILAVNAAGNGVSMNGGSTNNSIMQSALTGTGGTYAGLYMAGASNNNVNHDIIVNASGTGLSLNAGSTNNTISLSTVTGGAATDSLYLSSSTANTISQCYVANVAGGNAAYLDAGANGNTISSTTIVSNGTAAYTALQLYAASSNTIMGSFINNPSGNATFIGNGSSYNSVSQTTTTSGTAGFEALYFNFNANYNTVTQSYIGNPLGYALVFNANSNYNTVAQSTATSSGAGYYALTVQGASFDTLNNDYLRGSTAAWVTASTGTVITNSVLVATNSAGAALQMDLGSVGLTLTNSSFSAPPTGVGIALTVGNTGPINLTTDTITGARYGMLIGTPVGGGGLGFNNLTFSALSAGSTAMQFAPGTVVSTFSAVSFDASVGANVNAAALAGGSSITMAMPTGAKTGPAFSDDPNHYVHWPSSNAPTSGLTFPAAPFLSSLPSISGTAQAYSGAFVSSVSLSVQNLSNGLYWNGVSSFANAAPLFIPATVSTGTGAWSYINGTLSTSLTNGTSYQIQAQATDSYAQTQIGFAATMFTFDTSVPQIAITSPIPQANDRETPASLNGFSGTAFDPSGALAPVQIRVRNETGPTYWDPVSHIFDLAAASSEQAWFNAVSSNQYVSWGSTTNNISYAGLDGSTFTVMARALTLAGTFSTTYASNTFVYDSMAPQTGVLSPANGSFTNTLASLTGTAFDMPFANPGTVPVVQLRLQRLTDGAYWTGASGAGVWVSSVTTMGAAQGVAVASNSWIVGGANLPAPNNLATGLQSGDSYYVTTSGTDNADGGGNVEPFGSPRGSTFTFDNVPPVLYIQAPVANGVYSTLPAVSGTSFDAIAVATITLSVQQGGGNCFSQPANNFSAVCPSTFPAQGTPTAWSYAGFPWASGQPYTITVNAKDIAGNVSSSSDTFNFSTGTPLIGITSPIPQAGDRETPASLASLSGTAFDPVSNDVTLVQLRVRNESGPAYWDPTTHNFDLAASSSEQSWFNAVSTSQYLSWTSTANNISYAGLDGSTFTVMARSLNSAGSYSTIYSSNSFVYDSQAPQTGVTFPANSTFTAALASILGTAADLPSNNPGTVPVVKVRLQRLSDGFFWNGAGAWTPAVVALGAGQGVTVWSSSWSVAGANLPSGAALTSGGSYYITSAGTDNADGGGNTEAWNSPRGSTFTFDNTQPVSAITGPSTPYAGSVPNIHGTAQSFAGATVSSVGVSIQNLNTGKYWNGATFTSNTMVLSPAGVVGASTATWTYANGAFVTALTNGTSYQIQAQATDSYAQVQTGFASFGFTFDTVPPAVAIEVPISSAVYANLATISGTAADPVGVSTISLSIQQIGGNCYSPTLNNFTAACPNAFPAAGAPTAWNYSGAPFTTGHNYGITATATDAAGNVQSSTSTFTLYVSTALTYGTPGDGQGTATLLPASASGCQLVTATATFTVGAAGIAVGGAVAMHVPSGWTTPQGSTSTAPGYVSVLSATGYGLLFNPAQAGNNTNFGQNWVVYVATAAAAPGQVIQFAYSGYPGQGSQGPQAFSFESQGGGNGNFVGISSSPALAVTTGSPALLSFAPSGAMTVGVSQNSAPMQIQVFDACGVPTVQPAVPLTVHLSANVNGAADTNAVFYSTGGAAISSVTVGVGSGYTSSFYYNTSTAGVSFETLFASATLNAAVVGVSRGVNLLPAPAAINAVSVDTGTPGAAQNATIAASGALAQSAYINFTLSNPALTWQVIISSVPGTFTPQLAVFNGAGNPGRTVVWSGLSSVSGQTQFMPPGTYYVEIVAGGGSAVSTALSITIAPSASVYGVLTNGPGATVSAVGPNVGPGNFAVASSTGFFEIFGLQNGGTYLIQASSSVAISSSAITVTASSSGVVAATAGTNIGNLTFTLPSLLDVSATLPFAAPSEMWASVSVHNAGFTQTGSGSLHFSQGATASDNGAQSFGANASSWTSIALLPGTYEVDVALPALGISTAVLGSAVNTGVTTFLPIALQKQVNVYGYAILPSTVSANTWVSVQAQVQTGNAAAVFGGVTVPVSASSAIYSLFGLTSGTWTVTAVAQGALPAVSTLSVAGNFDVGTSTGGGFNLTLKSAGVLTGTLTVTGNTSQTNMSATCPNGAALCVPVTVYSPTSFYSGSVTVVLATSTTQTSNSFSLAGLPDGLYFLSAQLNGFVNAGQNVNVAGGVGSSSLTLTPTGSQLSVTVNLPGGPHPASDFKAVSLGFAGTQGESQSFADMTAGTTVQFFASSATVHFTSLNADSYQFQAFDATNGMYRTASASLATNATSSVLLDMSGSTYAVSGTFTLAATLNIPNSIGQSVVVSSVPGLLANTGALNYCLLGYSTPPSIPAAHLELLPANASGGFASGPLQTSGCPAGSNLISPLNSAGTAPLLPNPYLAYTAAVAANGSFSFPNVPPGVYQLRNNGQIDAAGDQIPQFSQTVIVTGTVSGLMFQIGGAATVSGSVLAPAGTTLNRSMTVSLANAQGQVLSSQQVNFNNAASASFSFTQIVSGNYTLLLQDSSYPKAYAAPALPLQVAGLNLTGQNLQAAQTGTIKGHIAIQENLPNGTQQFMLISAANTGLLPASFQVEAISNQGAFAYASGPNGGAAPVLDSNGEFVVDGLLAGTYSVNFTAPGAAGGVALVNTSVPGVVVQGGSVSDIGTANLTVGGQLSGKITDASTGLPLANLNVVALPSARGSGVSTQQISAQTDGNGRYVLNGLSPTVRFYDVYAAFRSNEQQGENLPPCQQTVSPEVDISTVSSLSFAVAPALYSLNGKIAAPAGGAALSVASLNGGLTLPGAIVYLQRTGVIPLRNPIADIQFQTDINGSFSIPSLTTGTYTLTTTSLGYSPLVQLVTVTAGSPNNVGTLTMAAPAGTLSGTLTRPDGSNPTTNDVAQIVAATSDQSSVLSGFLTTNPNTKTVTGYAISGFKPNLTYHVIILDSQNGVVAPPEASSVVVSSSSFSTINIVYRPVAPTAVANATRQGSGFLITYVLSQPFREKTASDDNYAAILTTVSAAGSLSQFALSQDRTVLTAVYTPGITESSFTLSCSGYTTLVNPDSTDPVNFQFPVVSTVTFFTGIDALGQSNIANLNGGDCTATGDSGRVTLAPGSFNVGVSSSVLVTLQTADEALSGTVVSGAGAAAARLQSLRFGTKSYPTEILAAVAAVPPTVNPLSAFYNIFLPLGVATSLAKPAQLTVAYSSGTDPSTLNLYWYNPAANTYVLTQDVTGAPPVINTANRTITLNVNHFSTYVLFNSAQAVISGGTGAAAFTAHNFPNPFDLGAKTVTPLESTGACSPNCVINGTMIGISIPPNISGSGTIRIFNVAGTLVRTFSLGGLTGGTFYYQNWDGTNDGGRQVASGAYIGELKVGSSTTFFRMALVKGSGL